MKSKGKKTYFKFKTFVQETRNNEIYENFLHPQYLELITFTLVILFYDFQGNNFYDIVQSIQFFYDTDFGGHNLSVYVSLTGNFQSLHLISITVSRHLSIFLFYSTKIF